MNLRDRFAKQLIIYRKNSNLSQEKLAELANIHRTYISQLYPERLTIRRNRTMGRIPRQVFYYFPCYGLAYVRMSWDLICFAGLRLDILIVSAAMLNKYAAVFTQNF
jgi:transcriptional regulator with XRE-family HTH domain